MLGKINKLDILKIPLGAFWIFKTRRDGITFWENHIQCPTWQYLPAFVRDLQGLGLHPPPPLPDAFLTGNGREEQRGRGSWGWEGMTGQWSGNEKEEVHSWALGKVWVAPQSRMHSWNGFS